ncbi:MFS transporter [Micromonospora inyonensis]|uniref:MFS transporter n=1 Tax=Micromonospora inyonensis TaxID=47866 RepID=UPI0024803FF8|nr:MFS transporter [Micromonospora inyonensis]
MAVLIGLLNVTLTAAFALLVLLARDRLGLGSVGYGVLLTCMAVGSLAGALVGDRLIAAVSATWTIRIGLLTEVALHLALAVSSDAYVVGGALALFGVHGALWGIVASSLRQRLTPPELLGRVGSANLFVAAGGNCVGALLGGVLAARFGLTPRTGRGRGGGAGDGVDVAGVRPGHGRPGVRRAAGGRGVGGRGRSGGHRAGGGRPTDRPERPERALS